MGEDLESADSLGGCHELADLAAAELILKALDGSAELAVLLYLTLDAFNKLAGRDLKSIGCCGEHLRVLAHLIIDGHTCERLYSANA